MRSGISWGVLVGFTACVPAPIVLEPPPVGNAKSAVYVIESEGREPLVLAVDLQQSLAPLPELAHLEGKRISMRALHYDCPAEVLGLKPGVVEVMGQDEGHPLPPAREMLEASVESGRSASWTSAGAMPPLRVQRTVSCAHFRIDRVFIPGTDTFTSSTSYTIPMFGVVTGASEVVVALSDGRFFRVSPSGSTPLLFPETTPHHDYYRAPDGTIWLYSADGRIVRGDFDAGFTEAVPNPHARGRNRGWIIGPDDPDAPFELFTLDDAGVFSHFDGTRWTRLGRLRDEADFGDELWFGGLAWVAPREAVAIGQLTYEAVRAKTGTITAEALFDRVRSPSLYTIKKIPAMGVVIGTAGGRLFVDDGTGWRQLLDSPLEGRGAFGIPATTDMAPLDEGVLFGGYNGNYAQYQPELEESQSKYCDYREMPPVEDLEEKLGGWHVSAMEPIECGYVLLTKQGTFSAEVEIDFLTRIP